MSVISSGLSVDIALASRSKVPVLILGRPQHRELWARRIHDRCDHADGPFVTCVADDRGLDEDAFRFRVGLARGGTLFIDGVERLSDIEQTQVLSLLNACAVAACGNPNSTPRIVRVIAGADRSIDDRRRDGKLSDEFFYRVNVIRIDLPGEV